MFLLLGLVCGQECNPGVRLFAKGAWTDVASPEYSSPGVDVIKFNGSYAPNGKTQDRLWRIRFGDGKSHEFTFMLPFDYVSVLRPVQTMETGIGEYSYHVGQWDPPYAFSFAYEGDASVKIFVSQSQFSREPEQNPAWVTCHPANTPYPTQAPGTRTYDTAVTIGIVMGVLAGIIFILLIVLIL
jgi:hypothetical protein